MYLVQAQDVLRWEAAPALDVLARPVLPCAKRGIRGLTRGLAVGRAENVQQATKSWVSLGNGSLSSGNPQMGGAPRPPA